MTDREAMQQALEALDWAADCIEPQKPHNCDCPVCVASDALRERLAQPERGCAECGKSGGWALYCVECMEKVPRREWMGLTEADGVQIAIDCGCVDVAWLVFARAIEAKLKEKNA